MSYENSIKAFEKACTLMPGGVNSPARAFGAVGGCPVFFERGEGAYLYDIDGNRYIDFVGSWGPMILGHCHPAVVEALQKAIHKGTSFGAPTVAENELCELVIDAMPSVEMVRLVNSGTEATSSAIRLARGYTGRDKIVKFAGCYHGHVDSLLVSAGSAAATFSVPNSPGVTAGTVQDTIILQYNDVQGVEDAFKAQDDKIAGVILEPVVGNMGCVLPTPEFRKTLRDLTRKYGAILIYDEVMTGFRVSYGGAQAYFGDDPDLTTMGKVIGGGLPVGAYGGKKEIMQCVIPSGPVFQAGTLSGNPLATAAGIATLTTLKKENPYPRLEQLGQRLLDGLTDVFKQKGIATQYARAGAMMTFFFNDAPVTDWTHAAKCDTKEFAQYFHQMLDRGVYMPCSQFEAFFLSAAHTEADIDAAIEAAK
ncbi:MAG: glutamate-1-semialdehyde 2,1-aminomutase [Thermoguttaceae bacterium]|nr:glutamate-1-semialdehyde 2,1-aminomutase [Thermoguttaceae bacterium]